MGDKIKSIPVIGGVATAYGLAASTDNYGNSIQGRDLTCASGEKIELGAAQWSKLHRSIETPYAQADMVPDGVVDLGTMESPLQTACKTKASKGAAKPGAR